MTETGVGAGAGPTALEAALGMRFRNPQLLDMALTHRSYAFEAGGLPTNERLEFLGDAVLGLVVTDWVYHRFGTAPEGRLAKIRAAAVNTGSLAGVAHGLGLGEAVKLGRGEEQSGGREKVSILADTMEAVFGAVYLDQGIEVAFDLIAGLFSPMLEEIASRRGSLDYKTSLQELTAGGLSTLPVYEVEEDGPDHQKEFTARVIVHGEVLGAGRGSSKKEAEQRAAEEAYAVLKARFAVVSDPGAGEPGHGPDPR
ncbi:MAG: ribonuclease III [Candidatus Rokuibacteriota bacterium]